MTVPGPTSVELALVGDFCLLDLRLHLGIMMKLS